MLSCARGRRTIRMWSFDARARGSIRPPLKKKRGIGKMRAVRSFHPLLNDEGETICMISARLVTRQERKIYEEGES